MVLSASAPDAAPRQDEPDWFERLSFILRFSERGVMVLIDRASPARLGDLVRGLLPNHPGLEVQTNALRLTTAEKGSVIILIPGSEAHMRWLNLERPLVAHKALRLILFCDANTSGQLAQRAPDFFNWISHRIECPSGPYLPAQRGIRAGLRARTPGLVWTGGDLEAAFADALPNRPLRYVSAALPYEELVEAARPGGRSWLAFRDIDGPFRLRRVRWALAEAGRRGRAILVEPSVTAPGFWPVHAKMLSTSEAITSLEQAGAVHAGRLGALVELEPEAVEIVSALLGAGVAEAELERVLLEAEDPGAKAADMAIERGITLAPDSPPLARALGTISAAAEDAVELGTEPRSTVLSLHLLAAILYGEGKYAEAERLLGQVLTFWERSFDVGSLDHASSLQLLADVLTAQGRYAEAAAILHTALRIKETKLGPTHPSLGPTLRTLAWLQAQLRRPEAPATARRALELPGVTFSGEDEAMLRAIAESDA